MKNQRLKLLQTSARVFAQKGYTQTSVREIVAAAKMNVSAVSYYFGDKRTLYVETLKYLLQQHRDQVFGRPGPLPTTEIIDKLSEEQIWKELKDLIYRTLDLKFTAQHLPLERIFTFAELEASKEIMTSLLLYVRPLNEMLAQMIFKLTGVPKKSPQMVLLIHLIFAQVNLSECDCFVLDKALADRCPQKDKLPLIKKHIWQAIQTILKSYKEEYSK